MKADAAISDAQGTTLPRYGFFSGVRVPTYRTPVINGELVGVFPSSETRVRSWLEPRKYQLTQTNLASTSAGHLLLKSWPQAELSVIRGTDVACVFVADWDDPTDSPWQELRRTLAPLRAASDALLEDINDTLEHEREMSARTKHAGLSAVARLVDVLGLNRPTILRMGGVPTSTFYAWQKNPHSVIRTPTVARLLRLQAQVAILDEALGRERMRAWVLSAERFDKLQADETAFGQVLSEAEAVLADKTRIVPRPRMRRADYASGVGNKVDVPDNEPSTWPGAAKLPERKEGHPR